MPLGLGGKRFGKKQLKGANKKVKKCANHPLAERFPPEIVKEVVHLYWNERFPAVCGIFPKSSGRALRKVSKTTFRSCAGRANCLEMIFAGKHGAFAQRSSPESRTDFLSLLSVIF